MNNRIVNVSLLLIVLTIAVYILRVLKGIFIPLFFAGFLQFMFLPLYRFLGKNRIPVIFIHVLVVIIVIGIFFGLGTVIFSSVNSFVDDFPKYEAKFQDMLTKAITHLRIPLEEARAYIANRSNWVQIFDRLSLSKVIASSMGTFFDFITKLLLTTIFLIFILAERHSFNDRLQQVLSAQDMERNRITLKDIENSVKKYIINKTLISVCTGLISLLWLSIFNVDFAVISAMLILIMNYIPNFGSIVATSFPILVSLLQFGFGWTFIFISILLTLTQIVMGNIIEPRFMGSQLQISPLIVLISLIFWYWIWGPIGMVLAVPILATLNIILKQFDSMRFITTLIASERPHKG